MTLLHLQLSRVISFLSLVSGRSGLHFDAFNAFFNGRLFYFIKRLLHSIYKEMLK